MADPEMTLSYQRGHELAGYLLLSVHHGALAEASRSGRGDRGRQHISGMLSPEQQDRLAGAMTAADLWNLTSSSRVIGDDEVPILITVEIGEERHEIHIWQRDAASNPDFTAFEAVVRDLVDELLSEATDPT